MQRDKTSTLPALPSHLCSLNPPLSQLAPFLVFLSPPGPVYSARSGKWVGPGSEAAHSDAVGGLLLLRGQDSPHHTGGRWGVLLIKHKTGENGLKQYLAIVQCLFLFSVAFFCLLLRCALMNTTQELRENGLTSDSFVWDCCGLGVLLLYWHRLVKVRKCMYLRLLRLYSWGDYFGFAHTKLASPYGHR